MQRTIKHEIYVNSENMKHTQHILVIVLTCLHSLIYGQHQNFTIGFNGNGISFGNSKNANGIRFNFDDYEVEMINGINIVVVVSQSKINNGLTFGFIGNSHSICNGIVVGGFFGFSEKTNGIAISGIGHRADKFNGLGIAGIGITGDTLNGVFMNLVGIGSLQPHSMTNLINGVTIGLTIGANAEKLNGVSISLFGNKIGELNGISIGVVNRSKKVRGIQIGLWNIAENNRIFRQMPIINFNFRENKK